jgi:hypothetical protein
MHFQGSDQRISISREDELKTNLVSLVFQLHVSTKSVVAGKLDTAHLTDKKLAFLVSREVMLRQGRLAAERR